MPVVHPQPDTRPKPPPIGTRRAVVENRRSVLCLSRRPAALADVADHPPGEKVVRSAPNGAGKEHADAAPQRHSQDAPVRIGGCR